MKYIICLQRVINGFCPTSLRFGMKSSKEEWKEKKEDNGQGFYLLKPQVLFAQNLFLHKWYTNLSHMFVSFFQIKYSLELI